MLLLVMGEEGGWAPLQGGSGGVLGAKDGEGGGEAAWGRGHGRGGEGGRGRVVLVLGLRLVVGRMLPLLLLLLLLLGFFLLFVVFFVVEMMRLAMTMDKWYPVRHSAFTLDRGVDKQGRGDAQGSRLRRVLA